MKLATIDGVIIACIIFTPLIVFAAPPQISTDTQLVKPGATFDYPTSQYSPPRQNLENIRANQPKPSAGLQAARNKVFPTLEHDAKASLKALERAAAYEKIPMKEILTEEGKLSKNILSGKIKLSKEMQFFVKRYMKDMAKFKNAAKVLGKVNVIGYAFQGHEYLTTIQTPFSQRKFDVIKEKNEEIAELERLIAGLDYNIRVYVSLWANNHEIKNEDVRRVNEWREESKKLKEDIKKLEEERSQLYIGPTA